MMTRQITVTAQLLAALSLALLSRIARRGSERYRGREPKMTPVGSRPARSTPPPNTGAMFPASIPAGRQSPCSTHRAATPSSPIRAPHASGTCPDGDDLDERGRRSSATQATGRSRRRPTVSSTCCSAGRASSPPRERGAPTSRRTRRRQARATSTASEAIELRVAAVVTDVLPNGNLIVSGSQEVRASISRCACSTVAGIVRPDDISPLQLHHRL